MKNLNEFEMPHRNLESAPTSRLMEKRGALPPALRFPALWSATAAEAHFLAGLAEL
jgi:hypothetical protein